MGLPAVVTPFDDAAEAPPDGRPPLEAVQTVTADCEAAVAIGEGDPDEMDESGAWISADLFTTWTRPENLR